MVIKQNIDNCNQYHNQVLFYVIPLYLYIVSLYIASYILIICRYGMLNFHNQCINISIMKYIVYTWLFQCNTIYIYILVKAENSKFCLSFLYNIYINLLYIMIPTYCNTYCHATFAHYIPVYVRDVRFVCKQYVLRPYFVNDIHIYHPIQEKRFVCAHNRQKWVFYI